jgi:hypothetical protein
MEGRDGRRDRWAAGEVSWDDGRAGGEVTVRRRSGLADRPSPAI